MNVADWLRALGLERYEAAFRENDVDAELLPDLTENDLKGLGVVSIGHRRRLLKAIAGLRLEDTLTADSVRTTSATAVNDLTSLETTAERRPLSVMFCDLVGSTALSSRLDPEDLREVIRTYQTCVAAIIQQFDGFIARYVGDGVLIYFGWPEARETDAERAVRAGLAVAAAVSAARPGAQPLQVRIGIATGLVVIGEPIGSGDSRQQTAVGETPNLAARLQGLAGPNQVVIDAATRRQIGGLFECQDLGTVELKGLPVAVPAWHVVSENRTIGQFEALRSGATPLVGREEEMELLIRRWEHAKAGNGRVVLISAEPGGGKSRLAEALAERIAAEPNMRLRYFCSPLHQDSTLYPMIAQMERAAGFAQADGPAVRLTKLRALLAATEPPMEDVALIAELHALRSADLALPLDLTPQRKKETTFEALLRQAEGLSRHQPVLVVFDDIHWIDPSTRELLDRLIVQVADWPVLVLAMFRPEFQPPWTGQPHVTMLTLARLDRRDTAAMVANIAGGAALPPEIADEIVERTDGVPLFVEELTRTVLESGAEGAATLSYVPHPALSMPATLHASLMARLDRLGPAAKDVAQTGAAIGREFGFGLLASTADLPAPQLREALDRLTNSGLLFIRGTPPQSSYIFKHALVQDAAYGTLLRGRRQQLHARIVAELESQFSDIGVDDPERLAQHCMEAGQAEKAIEYWRCAAETSISRSANVEAVRQTERALAVIRGLPESAERDARELRLLMPRGVGLQALHGYGSQQVHANYARANEICQTVSDIPELIPVLRGLYVHHLMKGSLSAAHEIGAHLLRLADQARDDGWRLEARFAFGQTLMFHEADFARAADLLAEGEALYDLEKHGRHAFVYGQDPGVYCLVLGGWARYFLGHPEAALNKMRRAIQIADAVGQPLSRAAARTFTTQLLQWLRMDAEVQEMAAITVSICEAHRLPFFRAWADVSLAWSLISDGRVELGRQKMASAIDAWRESGSELMVPYLRCKLAEASALAGEVEAGLAEIAPAFELAERNGERLILCEMHRLAGHVFETAEQSADAEEHYERAIRIAREQRAKSLELRSAVDLARLWAGRGATAQAADVLRPLCAFFTEGLTCPDLVDAKSLMERCVSGFGFLTAGEPPQ